MENTLVFIHGLESTAQGAKGQYFSQNFPRMIIEDYIGDFNTRMHKLYNILVERNNLIIVGSSYGGLMAVQYAFENAGRIKKLILLAPALNLPEFKVKDYQRLNIPAVIYHGTDDDVVNPYIVKDIAENIFSNLEHHLVKDDHPLHNTFHHMDWKALLLAK